MAKSSVDSHLIIEIGAVVDNEVCICHQSEGRWIKRSWLMLDVVNQRDDFILPMDAIANATARVIERCGFNLHVQGRAEGLTRCKIMERKSRT